MTTPASGLAFAREAMFPLRALFFSRVWGATRLSVRARLHAAPALGADTDAVLRELA
jgi:hypothetical protein